MKVTGMRHVHERMWQTVYYKTTTSATVHPISFRATLKVEEDRVTHISGWCPCCVIPRCVIPIRWWNITKMFGLQSGTLCDLHKPITPQVCLITCVASRGTGKKNRMNFFFGVTRKLMGRTVHNMFYITELSSQRVLFLAIICHRDEWTTNGPRKGWERHPKVVPAPCLWCVYVWYSDVTGWFIQIKLIIASNTVM